MSSNEKHKIQSQKKNRGLFHNIFGFAAYIRAYSLILDTCVVHVVLCLDL